MFSLKNEIRRNNFKTTILEKRSVVLQDCLQSSGHCLVIVLLKIVFCEKGQKFLNENVQVVLTF